VIAFCLVAVAFVAVALEVSMTPPPLAPRRNPASSFAGEWRGTARVRMADYTEETYPLHLIIAPDGRVTGTIGEATVEARFEWNRSWIGKALNLRTDYIVTGQVSGFSGEPSADLNEKLSMPLKSEGTYLRGALFIGKRAPSQVSLFRVQRQGYWLQPISGVAAGRG